MTLRDLSESTRIDERLVARLVADQFPHWTHLQVWPVEHNGHDNRTFRLGGEMAVRVPSALAYAAHLEVEHAWLPKLAQQLPLPISIPLAVGRPAHGLAWNWLVNTWIEGETAAVGRIDGWTQFAIDLAGFLSALQSIDATGAPPPGRDNFFRGGDLSVYDAETRACIRALRDVVDAPAATAVWESALAATWQSAPVWVHGDVAAGNLLVERGKLCGVIDFGQLAAGDPACDLTIAWTLLEGESRTTFRRVLAHDEATWARARGWALWKALLELRKNLQSNADGTSRVLRFTEDILAG